MATKYSFSGHWLEPSAIKYAQHATFVSVGIFPVLESATGKPKKGKVVVRVRGPLHSKAAIEAKASEICLQLEQGTYTGLKTVNV